MQFVNRSWVRRVSGRNARGPTNTSMKYEFTASGGGDIDWNFFLLFFCGEHPVLWWIYPIISPFRIRKRSWQWQNLYFEEIDLTLKIISLISLRKSDEQFLRVENVKTKERRRDTRKFSKLVRITVAIDDPARSSVPL